MTPIDSELDMLYEPLGIEKIILRLLLITVVATQCIDLADAAAAEGPEQRAAGINSLSSCELPGVPRPARCGVFNLPENPDRPAGRQLAIHVAVVPAAGGKSLPDPIVPLMGGPGEDAISSAAHYVTQFRSLLVDRDLLLIDQRGTGQSGALRCEIYSAADPAANLRDLYPPSAMKRCAQQLSQRADLTQYTYVHFSNDLEHIRRALGYGPMNLSAGSYGTRAAQVFVRTFPESVRTMVLGSVVPIDVPTPLTMAKAAQSMLEKTLSACVADAACHAAFPNVREEFRVIFARLESGAVRVADPANEGTVTLHRGRVAEWFRSLTYRPTGGATLPWIIHRAYQGDWTPVVGGILAQMREIDSVASWGLFFSITCNEDVPFIREQDVAPETRGTVLGDYRVRQQQAACKEWPKGLLPANYRAPVRSSLPTLFVSGDSDAAAPLWFTAHAASGFSNRSEVVARGQGHTEWNDCVGQLYEQFVRSGTVRGLDASSCKPVPRPAFKTQ